MSVFAWTLNTVRPIRNVSQSRKICKTIGWITLSSLRIIYMASQVVMRSAAGAEVMGSSNSLFPVWDSFHKRIKNWNLLPSLCFVGEMFSVSICTTQIIIREKQIPTAAYWTNIVIPFDHFVWIIVKVTILATLINFTFSAPNPVLEPLLEVLF